MEITYLGHACFKLAENGFSVIIDPYKSGSVPGIAPLNETANQVLASHKHFDHFAIDEVKLATSRIDTPFGLDFIDSFHDDQKGSLRGPNRISIFTTGDIKVVHMGDIGCMISDEEMEKISGCDVLMIPVGGFFTIDAKEAYEYVKAVKPGIVVPMHYRSDKFGYGEIATVDEFVSLFDDSQIVQGGSSITVESKTEGTKVMLMSPVNAR